jgi:uncharacterized protein (TIGR02145 family)
VSCQPDDDENPAGSVGGGNNNGGGASGLTQHTCGQANVHNADLTYGTMTDQEGQTYKTIVIGSQEWMAENLNTSTYRNGEPILTNLSSEEWENTINTQQGAWYYYNNNPSNSCPYGKLYNWYACVDSRNLCPSGWHIPSDAEWSEMINYLDPNADGGSNTGNYAGGKLKSLGTLEEGTGSFFSPNYGATNSSGFSAVAGSGCNSAGTFANLGTNGTWWSSTSYGANQAWIRIVGAYGDNVSRFGVYRQGGYSVRCVMD